MNQYFRHRTERDITGKCFVYTMKAHVCYSFGGNIVNEASSVRFAANLGWCQMYDCHENRYMSGWQ